MLPSAPFCILISKSVSSEAQHFQNWAVKPSGPGAFPFGRPLMTLKNSPLIIGWSSSVLCDSANLGRANP